MSVACARFKQNAWKKEMCSNCYKTKDEHQEKPRVPAPLLPLLPASQSILKGWEGGSTKTRKNVSFPAEECCVIGYGGEQGSSDEEWEPGTGGESDPEEFSSDPEEEKRLARITRTNTDFNSVPGNLIDDRPLPTSASREPVLVTVTPFTASQHLSRLLQDTAPTITPQEMPKEPGAQEPRKVSITRGSVLTKNSETAKNKLYIQNIIAAKDKKAGLGLDKVYIAADGEDKEDVVAVKNLANLSSIPGTIPPSSNLTLSSKVDQNTRTDTVCTIIAENRNAIGNPAECRKGLEEFSGSKKGLCELLETRKSLVLGEPMESREMAGEPDGKADSDGGEAAVTPPPRSSFLHTGKRPAPQPPAPESPPTRIHLDSPPTPTRIALDYPPLETSPLRRLSDLTASTTPSPQEEPQGTSRPVSLAIDPPPLRISVPPPESPRRDPPPPPPPTPPAVVSPPTPPPAAPSPLPPEPLPRHKGSTFNDVEKKKTKMKETIRKLLRFGSRDEMEVEVHSPRPRPQIIHPIDLNKSAVQVLPSANGPRTSSPEGPGRPGKPPPPPRSESLHLIERLRGRAPVPDGIYANLGEARSGIAPTKPARTGSLRETTKSSGQTTEVQTLETQPAEPDYEAVSSSTPECDRTSLPYYGSETESDTYSHTLFSRERWSVRRGRSIVVHPSEVDNITALADINYHSLRNIQRQTGERSRSGVNLEEYLMDGERMELGRGAVALSVERFGVAQTLLAAAAPTALILPPAVCRTFTASLPSKAFPHLIQPVHGEVAVVDRAVTAERLTSWAAAAEEEAALVLVQTLQIAECLALSFYAAEAFVVLSDSDRRPTVTYVHRRDEALNGGLSWRAVAALASEGAAPALAAYVCAAAGPEAALAAAAAWLWGPPATLSVTLLPAWLALQRAALLASLLNSEPTPLDSLHLAFLAAPVDLDAVHGLVSILDPPDSDSS